MKRKVTLPLALIVGIGVSAAAIQGLHAQTRKAFTITDVEMLDKAAYEALVKAVAPDIQKAGGQGLNTTLGKIVSLTGQPPKAVIIIQWDSLEKAEAYLKSPTYTNLIPQRDKAYKIIRGYIVEAGPNFTGFTLQGQKPKAYWIRELEVINQAALDDLPNAIRAISGLPEQIQEASRQAGRQATATANGKVVARVGEAPKKFALQGFSSLEQAEAFIKSPANTRTLPLLDKAEKITRQYIVEAAQ